MSSTYVRGLVSAGSSLARNRSIAFHLVSHLSSTDRGSHLSCGRSARWWPAAAASAFSTAVIASSRCPRTGSHPVNLWLQTKSPSVHEGQPRQPRSEEHTSELQSRFDLVCRLLLEKK